MKSIIIFTYLLTRALSNRSLQQSGDISSIDCAARSCLEGQDCVNDVGCVEVCSQNEQCSGHNQKCVDNPSNNCLVAYEDSCEGYCINEDLCGENQEYNSCGTCDPICGMHRVCSQLCRPGCYCKDGYRLDRLGGECIHEDQCPTNEPVTTEGTMYIYIQNTNDTKIYNYLISIQFINVMCT